MLLASPSRLVLLGLMGQRVTTHLSFVTERGDMSTIPSEYSVAVHPAGVPYTYSPNVARPGTLACGSAELPASAVGTEEASPRPASPTVASIAGRFLETRSARSASAG